MGRKHCGKRRNCSLRAISPFPSVFERFVLQIRKNQGLFGKGLKCLSSLISSLDYFNQYQTEKKIELNLGSKLFSFPPITFSDLDKNYCLHLFIGHLELLSSQSCVIGLSLYQMTNFSTCPN